MKKNKLTIIIHSDDKEKINYALSIGASAAAMDRTVELFFAGKTVNNLIDKKYLKSNNITSKFSYSNSSELLDANIELKTKFLICSGALHENKICKEKLRQDINWKITGITEIISNANSQLIFI
tara:strand:- start:1622 stop:1993 length:372 start_codon:yes stop_codon:yes gene_type:complete